MESKFKNLNVEEDTKILVSKDMKFDVFDVRYEKWVWEGTYGESVIFLSEDIKDKQDKELLEMVLIPFDASIEDATLTRGDEFTFINFGFNID